MRLRGNVHTSSIDRWKARVRLPICYEDNCHYVALIWIRLP